MAAEKKIGNDIFRCEKLGAREAQRLLIRLGKMLGPGFQKLVPALRAKMNGDEGSSDSAMVAMIGEILSQADVNEADDLLVSLCQQAQIKRGGAPYEQIVFDHHFQSDLLLAWQVAGLVLQVNFSSFFDGAAKTGLGKAMLSSARASSAA